jgi:hypothetical protein
MRLIQTMTLVAVGLTAAISTADTITVCWDGSGDYLTIQEGIDAAVDGDEVVVCDGTYTGDGNKDLDFGGRLITVRSANGPEDCTIDCEGAGRGFYFQSGETADAVVEGFTITNGLVEGSGGGVVCAGATGPTISNCAIIGNWAASSGGGVYCAGGSYATIIDCVITGNVARTPSRYAGGGGVYCGGHDTTCTLIGCTITGNTARDGAGINCGAQSWGSTTVILDCTISGNDASGDGGGLFCNNHYEDTGFTMANCTIQENTAYNGGGLFCWNLDASTETEITNCLIVENVAVFGAGGIHLGNFSNPPITNCTIGNNTALFGVGGIFSHINITPVTNCILWGNSGDQLSGDFAVTYSDVQGGWDGEGNIDADPLWVTASLGGYYLSQTAAGDPVDSPCVDAGSDTAANLGLDTRTTRTDQIPDSGIVDMGYHYPLGSPCPGDIDGDGDTDHADLGALLGAWDSEPGDANWNPDADLDGDGHVSHADLGILLGDWSCGT